MLRQYLQLMHLFIKILILYLSTRCTPYMWHWWLLTYFYLHISLNIQSDSSANKIIPVLVLYLTKMYDWLYFISLDNVNQLLDNSYSSGLWRPDFKTWCLQSIMHLYHMLTSHKQMLYEKLLSSLGIVLIFFSWSLNW